MKLNRWQKLWIIASAVWAIFLFWWLDQWRMAPWSEILSDPEAWAATTLMLVAPPAVLYGVGMAVRWVIGYRPKS